VGVWVLGWTVEFFSRGKRAFFSGGPGTIPSWLGKRGGPPQIFFLRKNHFGSNFWEKVQVENFLIGVY